MNSESPGTGSFSARVSYFESPRVCFRTTQTPQRPLESPRVARRPGLAARFLASLVQCLRRPGSPSDPAPFIPALSAGRVSAPLPAGQISAPQHSPRQPLPPQPIARRMVHPGGRTRPVLIHRKTVLLVTSFLRGRRRLGAGCQRDLRSLAGCDFRAFVRFAHEDLARAFLARAPRLRDGSGGQDGSGGKAPGANQARYSSLSSHSPSSLRTRYSP